MLEVLVVPCGACVAIDCVHGGADHAAGQFEDAVAVQPIITEEAWEGPEVVTVCCGGGTASS
jgi:hypothetical protein